MRNITFIGTLNSTFASRWREKLFPEQVQTGRDYAKKKAEGRRILNKDKTLIESAKENAAKARKSLKIGTREKFTVSPGYYSKRSVQDFEKEMIQDYKNKRNARKNLNSTPLSSKVVSPSSNPKTTSLPSSNPSPLKQNVENVKVTPTTTPLLQPKSKLGMKGKLGIGAVGLLTVGALGYGLTRKTRSDKGKKRK